MRSRRHRKLAAVHLLAPARAAVAEPDLNARLGQSGALRDLLARVDVGVVSSLEGFLQLLELFGRKRGATAPLLAIATSTAVRLGVRI